MQKKILVVDDNENVLEILTHLLQIHNYQILTCEDALQATMMALNHKPDLILLDLMLPAGGGTAVYARLKKSPETENIPIIFLSAATLDIMKEKYKGVDSKYMFTKPWDNQKLLEAIKEILK